MGTVGRSPMVGPQSKEAGGIAPGNGEGLPRGEHLEERWEPRLRAEGPLLGCVRAP